MDAKSIVVKTLFPRKEIDCRRIVSCIMLSRDAILFGNENFLYYDDDDDDGFTERISCRSYDRLSCIFCCTCDWNIVHSSILTIISQTYF